MFCGTFFSYVTDALVKNDLIASSNISNMQFEEFLASF